MEPVQYGTEAFGQLKDEVVYAQIPQQRRYMHPDMVFAAFRST